MKHFITDHSERRKCYCDCRTLWHYGTSLLPPPPSHVWTRMGDAAGGRAGDLIITVMTWIGDFDALCKRVKQEKQLLLLLEGFHSNSSHHTAPWTDHTSGKQKHLESWRDENLTGFIVGKFEAGTTGDLVLSRTWIKNSLLLCHLVSCCTDILSGCLSPSEKKCSVHVLDCWWLSSTCRCQREDGFSRPQRESQLYRFWPRRV